MVKSMHYQRMALLGAVLLAGLGWLGWNFQDIQVRRSGELRAKAEQSYVFDRHLPAVRGEIRDRHNRVLVVSQPVKSVFVNPCLLGEQREAMARLLAFWLQTDPAQVRPLLRPRLLKLTESGSAVFDTRVRLRTKVSWEEWGRLRRLLDGHWFGFDPGRLTRSQQLQLRRLRTQAVFAEDDLVRVALNGSLAAHVLGHVGLDEVSGDWKGLSGIESALDPWLRGVPGRQRGERDVRGRDYACRDRLDQAPVDGLHAVLTLDAGAQQIVEAGLAEGVRRFHAKSGAAGLVVPQSGRVLALASAPSFDLQDLGRAPSNAWPNRMIAHVYEPGSVFKLVVYSALLEEGLADMDTLVDCTSRTFHYHGVVLHDPAPLGWVPCSVALAHSSNVAAGQLGPFVGAARLHRYAEAFGFGRRTGILLPGEHPGRLHPLKQWSSVSAAEVAVGYEVMVTPLQVLMATSCLANGGRLMRPMLVERLEDSQGRIVFQSRPMPVRQVIREQTARTMTVALTGVLAAEGTGWRAALDGIPVAGKTGTSHKCVDGRYDPNRCHATFCGYFPAFQPEFCLVVMLEEPQPEHQGGQTAAPVFRQIASRLARYFNLPTQASPAPAPTLAQARP